MEMKKDVGKVNKCIVLITSSARSVVVKLMCCNMGDFGSNPGKAFMQPAKFYATCVHVYISNNLSI